MAHLASTRRQLLDLKRMGKRNKGAFPEKPTEFFHKHYGAQVRTIQNHLDAYVADMRGVKAHSEGVFEELVDDIVDSLSIEARELAKILLDQEDQFNQVACQMDVIYDLTRRHEELRLLIKKRGNNKFCRAFGFESRKMDDKYREFEDLDKIVKALQNYFPRKTPC